MDTDDRPRSTLICLTADDDRFAAVRRAATELAARESAALVLYDWDAPMLLGDPLPSVWSADGTDAAVPDRLDAPALEAAGRASIARQVRAGTRVGIETSAWLPSVRGAKALLRYALDHDATAIVVPADIDDREVLHTAESEGAGPRIVVVRPSQAGSGG